MEKAVDNAKKMLKEKMEVEFEFKIQLTTKETEGDIKLKSQIIKDLQEKIESLNQQNKQLLAKVEKAELDAKEITLKAIETSGNKPIMFERNYKKEDNDK